MFKPTFKRPRDFYGAGRQFRKAIAKQVATKTINAIQQMQIAIMGTPVYTGKTLVNFRWSVGGPIEGIRAAVKQPALPGKTSDKSIGSEPRRAANAAVVRLEMEAVIASIRVNPFQRVFLVNNHPNFLQVEYGSYARKGKTSRTPPGGMVRRGEVAVTIALEGIGRNVS